MSNPKVQVTQKSVSSTQPKLVQKNPDSTFSQNEIRVRAYQIYESRGSIHNRADEDWSQAETELMEIVGGK